MKKNIFKLIIVSSTLFASCDKSPIESEQYKKLIYLVGAQDVTRQVELEYSTSPIESFVSISSSGSLNIDRDVKINLTTPNSIIADYNAKYFNDDEVDGLLRPIKSELYNLPNSDQLTIKSSENIFVRQPILIHTENLHPDSVHAIPFMLDKVSDFEINTKLNELILLVKLKNKFSGNYSMIGTRKNLTSNAINNLQKNKVLQAVSVNKLRMYISDVSESKTTRNTETVVLTINDDNTISVSSWNTLQNVSGSGMYDPVNKTIKLKYKYTLNNISYDVNEDLIFTK